jgi:hypothetical protein
MTDVLFRFDVDAPPETVREALKTTDGIKGFWTSRAEVPSEVGQTVTVGFAIAPAPFDLRLEPREDGSTVSFRHAGFTDDVEAGMVAYTWGQIMVRLKEYAESGRPNPLFT